MNGSQLEATFGAIAGVEDDHPGNPAFFVHGTDVLRLIDEVHNGETAREAAVEIFLFLYMAVLDLYRKSMYVYRATRRYLSPHTHFSQDELELLRLVALNHEAVEEAKPRRRVQDGQVVPPDQTERRRNLYAIVEALEQQVHELWAGHQEGWHRYIEEITNLELTRPLEPDLLDDHLKERRRDLEVVQRLKPSDSEGSIRWERRRSTDSEGELHQRDRRDCARAAQPRRVSDDPTQDFSRNGVRKPVIVVP